MIKIERAGSQWVWIEKHTEGHTCVVDFGAGEFRRLNAANSPVRVGIEIYKPYIERSKGKEGTIHIHGDMREFEKLLKPEYYDCAMMYDTLEHLTKKDGFDLLKRMQKYFKKIMIKVPEGYFPQDGESERYGDDDDNEWQEHKSEWYAEDLDGLGFEVILDKNYFRDPVPGGGKGCLFAVWMKH